MKNRKLTKSIAALVAVAVMATTTFAEDFEPEFVGGYPTEETAKAMFEEYDYQAAVQFYVWGYAYLNGMGFDKGLTKLGGDENSVFIFDKRVQPKHQIMTANSEVIYVWTRFMDVSKGPIVLEVPPRVMGHLYDVGMRAYCDLGAIGPDRGKGGKYLLVSKDYKGEEPEGYFVVRPEYSNLILLGARTFPTREGSVEKAVEHAKGFKRYYYNERDNQQEQSYVFAGNRPYSQEWPRDERAFEWLAEIFNKDRVPESAKAHLGNMRKLGIEVGKSFNPDARAKKILKRAAKTGEAMILSMAFGQRDEKQDRVYDNRQYMAAFPNKNTKFMLENYEEVEERARGWHELVGNFVFDLLGAPAGKGQFSMVNYNDANGDHLMGEHTYRLRVPADVPVNNFWQVPVYSVLTRAMIDTDQGRYAFTSHEEFIRNEDGSVDLYFGPKAPKGFEKNWVKTIPGQGWFTLPRLYGALQPVLDKTWRWNDIEKIK